MEWGGGGGVKSKPREMGEGGKENSHESVIRFLNTMV